VISRLKRTGTPDGSRVSDYQYELPPELIAQYPADRRDESRLLVLPPSGPIRHRRFPELLDLLERGDVLVVNESRVVPARLVGRKPTGAPAEVLLVRPLPAEGVDVWEALVRPGGKLKPGRRVLVGEGLEVEVVDSFPSGSRLVRLIVDGDVDAALERYGRMPLPPYIERPDEPLDRDRYQTVYARTPGSIAAPTAGLHFTEELLERLDAKGVARAAVTLHVGVGTFRPVEGEDPAAHRMHAERYVVGHATVAAIEAAWAAGGRVWAVGTTAVRTLESVADEGGRVRAGEGETRLFIRPPYEPRVVDALLTNFHLPRSTLLMLVAALAGYDRTMAAYEEAVRERYRFYSYGDAMAVLPRG
jgi:S-adenosylmethionine:tRNA ribosyltransferase-isomerase